jgi:hypothetical protein
MDALIEQRPVKLNFRHGQTYLTPSKVTALRYAISNKFGSEVLSMSLELFQRLESKSTTLAKNLAAKFPHIIDLLSRSATPILVEVERVPIRMLRSEAGRDPSPIIADTPGIASAEVMWQQHNFETTEPIPTRSQRYFSIRVNDPDPIFPDYSLEPLALDNLPYSVLFHADMRADG